MGGFVEGVNYGVDDFECGSIRLWRGLTRFMDVVRLRTFRVLSYDFRPQI